MKGYEILEKKLGLKFKKTKRDTKLDELRRYLYKRGMSLFHKETVKSYPKDRGIITVIPKYVPSSFQTKCGKRIKKRIQEEGKKNKLYAETKAKIGDKDLEVFLIYKLIKSTRRDVDNYTKNIIDAYKGILFEDDNQIKLLVSRIDYINEVKKYSRALEKVIIRIDFLGKSNITSELDKIFSNNFYDKIPDE